MLRLPGVNSAYNRFCTSCGTPLVPHALAPTAPNALLPTILNAPRVAATVQAPFTPAPAPTAFAPPMPVVAPTAQAAPLPVAGVPLGSARACSWAMRRPWRTGYTRLAPVLAPTPMTPIAPTPSLPSPVAHGYARVKQGLPGHAVNVVLPASGTIYLTDKPGGPHIVLRALYFVFIGLWLGALWTTVAWALTTSMIGLLLGFWMLGQLPWVMTLRPARTETRISVHNGVVTVHRGARRQRPFLGRALYFLLAGWWLSALWLAAAWAFAGVTLGLGLPLSFWMFSHAATVTTLRR